MITRQELRDVARRARQALKDREERSQRILDRVFASAEFTAARSILFYVHVRTEVQTQNALPVAAALGKKISVPYCVANRLRLFHWQRPEDLAAGTFGILEPRRELLEDGGREVSPEEIDLVLVPGLIFDRHGGRLGYGRGYYDRLLAELPAKTIRMGLAFDCQIVDHVPQEPHDQPVQWLVTESQLLRCVE